MTSDGQRAAAVSRILRWCSAMGADEATAAVAVDWLDSGSRVPGAEVMAKFRALRAGSEGMPKSSSGLQGGVSTAPMTSLAPPSPQAMGTVARMPARTFASDDASALAARERVGKAGSLAELAELLAGFDGCGLKATAKNLCFFRGSEQAEIMIIGEAPGRDEDLAGQPFVGRAGKLLDMMLMASGLAERRLHITNIVYWRPPGNRTPSPQEAQVCRPFLDRQVALAAPQVAILLGAAAARSVLGTSDGIMKVRGKWSEVQFGDCRVKTLATLHPAFLLRSPGFKQLAWRDLLTVRAALETI